MILIAGSSGIIGSFLTKELKKNNYEYVGIGNEEILKENQFQIDLTDTIGIDEFIFKIKKPEMLLFLVGLAHEKGAKKDFDKFNSINFNTLKNLLNSLEKYGKVPKKIIFTSTISVYGERIENKVYDEDCMTLPRSPYAQTKLNAEKYLLKHYSNQAIILRLAPVYSSTFLLNILRRIKLFNKYFRIGKGDQKLSLLNIKNIFFAIEQIIQNKVPNGIYNLSDSCSYTYNKILSSVHANKILVIPSFVLSIVLYASKMIGNYRIEENAMKLLKDNVYPNTKLRKYIELPFFLEDFSN